MNRLLLITFPALLLVAGLCCKGEQGRPRLEGFPWPDPAAGIVLEVPRVDEMPLFDGDLDEPAWENAGVIKKLFRAEDTGVSPAAAAVGVLYDGAGLMFSLDLPGADAAENPGQCYLSGEHDLTGGPHVRICLDPPHRHGVYYQFIIDPAGRRQDMRVFDESWSADWTAAVVSEGGRLKAEVFIPVAGIFGAPEDGEVWGFNVALFGIGEGGDLSSTPILLDLADAERFGHLLFRGGLDAESIARIRADLPEVHRQQKQARLADIRKMCGPEPVELPGKLYGLAPGREYPLQDGLKITCLGLDNPRIVRSRYPFFYEKYENPDLQRLRERFRLDEIIAPGRNEFEQMLLLNEWLAENVPFGRPALIRPQAFYVLEHGLAGQTFNCTYLSFTLAQLYTSLGWTARKMTSAGHGTLDVWSNYWRKWVQIDPSRNSYFRVRGKAVPLNSNEIRREFWRNQGVDMEMVFGTGQRAEKVTLERRERDGLYRYRQDGYAWVAYKNRNNFLEVPYAYRNFIYLMVEDEYDRGKKWLREDGRVDERYLFSILTDRPGDIFWTLNQAFIHLYEDSGRRLKVQLETVAPNFLTFEVAFDHGEWRETGPVFSWELHPGQNFLQARARNKFGRPGPEHKVVLAAE
ncbi:MAG: hypothetical protein JXQ83_13320 [Candidatus Glassbacteria bacterium]|nr:hypothetical protein [Candidatus Glassbacteria bacterium]